VGTTLNHSNHRTPIIHDVALIGGGIVGMATALRLLGYSVPGLFEERPPRVARSLVVLEAERTLGAHQTGRNSGVIHSGLYYKPGSLKARLCAEGRDAMYAYCLHRGLPFERCGKIVVAVEERELPELAELERRALANGLTRVRRIGKEQIRELEPHCAGIAALHVGETGIADYRRVVNDMAHLVGELGGDVRLEQAAVDVRRSERGVFVITTGAGEVCARAIINCAGLHSDRVARMCGVETGVRIVPFRGEYYDLIPERRGLVKDLIYPVRDPRYPFLGVHFTRATDGTVEAGPNAVLAMARHGYDWSTMDPRDLGEVLAFPGFWRLMGKHWRMGVMEVQRSLNKDLFVRSMQTLIPEVRSEDVVAGRAGIRAQAMDAAGNLVDDFHIVEGEGQLHVLNAPSPAATASLAIGRQIAGMARRTLA
jgi:L-2-hydroxyglutarate oxidase